MSGRLAAALTPENENATRQVVDAPRAGMYFGKTHPGAKITACRIADEWHQNEPNMRRKSKNKPISRARRLRQTNPTLRANRQQICMRAGLRQRSCPRRLRPAGTWPPAGRPGSIVALQRAVQGPRSGNWLGFAAGRRCERPERCAGLTLEMQAGEHRRAFDFHAIQSIGIETERAQDRGRHLLRLDRADQRLRRELRIREQ